MKYTKKLVALTVALILALALAAPTFAANVDSTLAGAGSVELNGTISGKSYEFYRVFDLTYSGTGEDVNVSYTINSDWTAFFSGDGVQYISDTNTGNLSSIIIGGATKYINITESNKASFAEDALNYVVAGNKTAVYTLEASDTIMKVTGLPLGYYLIYPVGASQVKEGYASICSLTNTTPDAEATVKSDSPDINKTVSDSEVEIGQTVTYTLTGQVPSTEGYQEYTYQVTDQMSDGLTFNKNVTVKFGENPITIDGMIDYDIKANGFVLTFDMTQYQEYKFQKITITYTATVNENAAVENSNDYELGYGDPADGLTKVPKDPVKVYTCKVVIDKYDGADSTKATKLPNAKFVLYKMDNSAKKYYKYENNVVTWVDTEDNATVVTTDPNGAAEFKGIQSGTYYVHETEAPAGYNLATQDQVVIVKANGTDGVAQATATAQVENNSGAVLPGTGGIGTTIFYTLGGLLVVGAAVLLVTKKRVHDMEA